MHVPAYPVKVRDVSGAGDTVVATLAALLAAGVDFEQAVRIANAAASVVVGKRGTAVVTPAELRARILPSAALASEEKIVFDWNVADERVREWRAQGLRVGFTNGCFDIAASRPCEGAGRRRAAPATGWWLVSTAMPR